MKPELGTKEYTNTLIDTGKNLGLNLEQYRQPVLNSQTLGGNERAFNIPAPTPNVEASGLQGMLEANANSFKETAAQEDQFSKNLQLKSQQAEQAKGRSMKDYLGSILGTKGQTELTTDAYSKEGGVDEVQKELNKINQDILVEQAGLQRQVEELEKNNTGMFGGALSDKIEEAKRASLRKQADLSIIQMGIQGRYDSAKAIADRAVAVQLERDKTKNETLKTIYEDNKDLFTTAEQRLFETSQADRERKLDTEEANLKSIYELAIDAQQNGAPTSLVQNILKSKTKEEALASAGNYIGLLDRQTKILQNEKLRKEIKGTGGITIESLAESIGVTPEEFNQLPSGAKNTATLTAVLGNADLGQGTKTQVANVLGVINATTELANARASGKFQGLSPVQKFADFLFPETLLSPEATENRGYLDAINLKVQQWASGAALTEKQTEQVERFTPKRSDSDSTVKTKMNNLVNFMLTQAQSQLQSEGVQYTPEKVNLFEANDLLQQATPEQLEELRAAGLIQ